MAAPFLAPMVSLVPVFKVLALGSVKFVGRVIAYCKKYY